MRPARAAIFLFLLGHLASQVAAPQQSAPAAPLERPSAAPPRAAPVAVAEMAPDFTLEDEQGRRVKLSQARGKMPTVLVFYRGYW